MPSFLSPNTANTQLSHQNNLSIKLQKLSSAMSPAHYCVFSTLCISKSTLARVSLYEYQCLCILQRLLPLSAPFSIIKRILKTALLLVTSNFVSSFGLCHSGVQSHFWGLCFAWLDRAHQRRSLPQKAEFLLHRTRSEESWLLCLY